MCFRFLEAQLALLKLAAAASFPALSDNLKQQIHSILPQYFPMELTVSIPEKYVISISPDALKLLLKLNTAIDLYRSGQISSGAAIEFIGEIDRFEFLYECKKRGIEPQTYEDIDELEAEIAMLDRELP